MAHSVVNLTYIGQPSNPASGQAIADQTSGPKAKTLYAVGTIVNGSSTFSTETATTVNFIDGVQTFGRVSVLQFQSVTAPATINGTANTAVYSSVGPDINVPVGVSITFAGFANSGNNGTFTVTAVNSTSISVVNSSSVAETNPSATGTYTVGGIPVWVDVFYAGASTDSSTTATASNNFYPSNIVGTGFQLNHNSFTTTGVTVTFGAIIAFSS